jgi:hypothetical protein
MQRPQHTANNTEAVFSLCPRSSRMLGELHNSV